MNKLASCVFAVLVFSVQHLKAYELFAPQILEPIEIYSNIPGSAASGPWQDAVEEAADAWESRSGVDINIISQTVDPCTVDAPYFLGDELNSVAFADDICGFPFDEDTLAVTLGVAGAIGELFILEADIIVNESQDYDIYSGPGKFPVADFRRVIVHELGHVLGLNHEDDVPSIMAPAVGNTELPTNDDLDGIDVLYGNPFFQSSGLQVNLEEPANGAAVTGVSNIRGWAVGNADIRFVELLVDGQFYADIPIGGSRQDVENVFPGHPGSEGAGFSMAMAWSLLSPGEHTLTARATDSFGRTRDADRTFDVISFDSDFVRDPADVVINGELEKVGQNRFRISSLQVEGTSYDVILEWQTGSQKFEIVEISPAL